jgi:hypothetical protein
MTANSQADTDSAAPTRPGQMIRRTSAANVAGRLCQPPFRRDIENSAAFRHSKQIRGRRAGGCSAIRADAIGNAQPARTCNSR